MQSTLPETSPIKAGRRVLGEKNANASLTPSAKRYVHKQKLTTSDAIPFNPLKETRKDRGVSTEPPHAGQKRTIDQVTDSEAEDVEPRKALVTSHQPGTDQEFQIFDEDNKNTRSISQPREISPISVDVTQASEQLIPSQRTTPLLGVEEINEPATSISTSSVPTEPAARRIFIQEKAALVRKRLQSAMHRVGKNSLDHALSQFEATSRPFVPRGCTMLPRASSSPSLFTDAAATNKPASQTSTPKQQKRVLLPPLPIQPNSRPVRGSARTSAPSPFSESACTASREEEAEKEVGVVVEEEEDDDKDDDDEDEETPRAQIENRQRPEADVEAVHAALDEANALSKLKELAQSSRNAEHTIGR